MTQAAKTIELTAGEIVRDAMCRLNNDRDAVTNFLIRRRVDDAANEEFRVLGIKQLVRNFQTAARSGVSSEKFVAGTVTQFARRPRPSGGYRVTGSAPVQRAKQAVKDMVEAFMGSYTLFGGQITLKDATRPDMQRCLDSYGAQRGGIERKEKFIAACMAELPAGSVVAKLPISKWPIIYDYAKKYEVLD